MSASQTNDGQPPAAPAAAQAAATVRDMEESQRRAHALLEELQSLLEQTTISGGAGNRGRNITVIQESPNADGKGLDNIRSSMPNNAAVVRSQPNSVNGLRPLYKRVETEMRGNEKALGEFRVRFAGALVASDSACSESSVSLSSPATRAGDIEEGLVVAVKRIRSRIDCSNLASAEARWVIIKRCRDLKAVGQKFEKESKQRAKQESQGRGNKRTKKVALVDAVVDGGATWLRVLGIAESRLLHEMAEAGWDWGGEDQGDGADGAGRMTGSVSLEDGDEDDDMDTISLIQTVQGLTQAARCRSRSQRPRTLHIVLTRVREHSHQEISRLLGRVRRMGTSQAERSEDLKSSPISIVVDAADSPFCTIPAPPLAAALQNLAPPAPARDALGRVVSVGPVANLDASTLMALISDISHAHVPEQAWHRPDIRKQVRAELSGVEPTAAGFLYPLLAGRGLVCTLGAARRVRQIVDTLGSGGEAARLAAVLPPPVGRGSGSEDARRELQRHSVHPVPSSLRLPIRVIDARMTERWEALVKEGALPQVAGSVARDLLNDVNMESFLYGWEADEVTTVTANQTLAQQILKRTESDRARSPPSRQAGDEGKQAPRLYVHTVRRSLGAGQQIGGDDQDV